MLVGDTTRLAPLATQVELAEALGQQIVEGQSRLGPIHLHGGADRLDRLVEIIVFRASWYAPRLTLHPLLEAMASRSVRRCRSVVGSGKPHR